MTRYACVRVAEFPVQALLRLRAELRGEAVVVMEGAPPAEAVCAATAAARRMGLEEGMSRVEVDSFGGVRVLARSRASEREAKQALVEAMCRFSPRVEDAESDRVAVCVVDVAGTERLFGAGIGGQIQTRVGELGMVAVVVVCGDFHASVALARGSDGVVIIPSGGEREALAGMSLGVLDVEEEQQETLAIWGVKTVGGLAALPEVELIARMGQEGKRLRLMALGECPHLFQAVEEEFSLREVFEFDGPVEESETLLFVLGPMFDQMLVRARGRALALASVSVAMLLDGGGEHVRVIRPALPTENRKLLLKLFQLDLASHAPEKAVIGLMVTGETGGTSKVQMGLFAPQLPESSRLDVTLARLSAMVGEGRVGSAVLRDSHEPDAFSMVGFRASARSGGKVEGRVVPAMRRVRPPMLLRMKVLDGEPRSFAFRGRTFQVVRAYGPWKGSGEWWNGGTWGREEWDLVAEAVGERLFCRVFRDMVRNAWMMDGLYD
ncbi:DNA polymerase Y family protein [Granulicella sibirica]|nr:DNA polymerase Y family protein [Granulicella sibirica]